VGATGTVTAAHLDYRILKNGKYLNPLTELSRMPPGEPIGAAAMAEFERERDEVLRQLESRTATPPPAPGPGGSR
jgi:hypothetical protein